MRTVPHIETERLSIRPLDVADAPVLAAIWADPEVTRHMGGPRDFDEIRTSLEDDARQDVLPRFDLWPLVEKATTRVVGHCGLLDKDVDGRPEVELVYVLAADVWGRGYATEIAAIRDYAFHDLGLSRVIALIDPDNIPSARVAQKIGMRLEKETRRSGGAVRHVYAMQAPPPTARSSSRPQSIPRSMR